MFSESRLRVVRCDLLAGVPCHMAYFGVNVAAYAEDPAWATAAWLDFKSHIVEIDHQSGPSALKACPLYQTHAMLVHKCSTKRDEKCCLGASRSATGCGLAQLRVLPAALSGRREPSLVPLPPAPLPPAWQLDSCATSLVRADWRMPVLGKAVLPRMQAPWVSSPSESSSDSYWCIAMAYQPPSTQVARLKKTLVPTHETVRVSRCQATLMKTPHAGNPHFRMRVCLHPRSAGKTVS